MNRMKRLFWKIVDKRIEKFYNDPITFIILTLYLEGEEYEL